MIKAKGIDPPNRISEEESQRRQEEINSALCLEISELIEFETTNIKSWKASFYRKLRSLDTEKRFTFAKQEENKYRVWRIK